ncbi:MAG: hypothetical protein AB7F66_06045 [Bacteriovoracia bacterium]
MLLPAQSREGIPWREYAWPALLIAIPLSLVLEISLKLYGLTLRRAPTPAANVPRNAIVFLFHGDIYCSVFQDYGAREFGVGTFLGAHSFLSYVWIWRTYWMGYGVLRYDRRRQTAKLIPWIVDYMNRHASLPFALRTDSGGPYGKVRGSIVDLARATNRPVVGARQLADRAWVVRSHALPLPFARLQTRVTVPIFPAELEGLSREDAMRKLQIAMDALASEPGNTKK